MVKYNHNKYKQLRKTFVSLTYENYSISMDDEKLNVVYHFNLSGKYHFYPKLTFLKKGLFVNEPDSDELENFVFNMGMIELISYWKSACPPFIYIKPFNLSEKQILWWKKIYFHGLGEFFYMNKIVNSIDDFVHISCNSDRNIKYAKLEVNSRKVIVPIGGGKDSVVTLELLKDKFDVVPLIVNPRRASLETIKNAGFSEDDFFEIKRSIHPQLLELNKKGFLNGHTPFSAMLAFVCLLSSALTGCRHIALSNESSANEPTDLKSGVNHQYSKSYEFEKDFREYVAENITSDINYFSFLRPLGEYQIAERFARLHSYFKVFKSCNVGSKEDLWCGSCSKCLFTFIILSPFVDRTILIDIFGHDLFDDENMKKYFDELTGINTVKPFECVGTVEEVNLALRKTIEKCGVPLPYLLKYYKSLPLFGNSDYDVSELQFQGLNQDHFLSDEFLDALKTVKRG